MSEGLMPARDYYPIMARTASFGADESEAGWLSEEIDAALDEIDGLRTRVAALEAALAYALTHEHDDDVDSDSTLTGEAGR